MNLVKLFELQKQADERWKDEPNRLEKDILWLQVELGELANEWRGFKYRRKDQKPRYERKCHACNGIGGFIYGEEPEDCEMCGYCDGTGIEEKPILREYTDALQVILSIGIYLGADEWDLRGLEPFKPYGDDQDDIVYQYVDVLGYVGSLRNIEYSEYQFEKYTRTLEIFIGLGEMLNLQWEDIERCFEEKIERNKERQGTT